MMLQKQIILQDMESVVSATAWQCKLTAKAANLMKLITYTRFFFGF